MLKLFRVGECSETHSIAANSEEAARYWATTLHGMRDEDIEFITEVPPAASLAICLEDGPEGRLPSDPIQDGRGAWFCTASVADWLAISQDGDMICSSVF